MEEGCGRLWEAIRRSGLERERVTEGERERAMTSSVGFE
jgi:hypothetical protein